MRKQAQLIGIDVGTTNLKILVLDGEGRILDQTMVRYPLETRPGGVVTQDPADWWKAIDQGFAEIRARTDLSRIRALSHSSQGETLVLCDREGTVLAPAISWMDSRARDQADRLARERTDWYARTGKQVSCYGWTSKIAWLREYEPRLYDRVGRFCQVSDHLTWELAGRWICDINNASLTYFVNVRERAWDPEIVQSFQLEGLLPELAESGTVAGPLKPELARRWGLGTDAQVIVGGHDQGCAALGAAPPEESSVMLATGTAWVLYCPLKAPAYDPREKMIMYCHALPGAWAWLAPYSGGAALDVFLNQFCATDRANLERLGHSVYDSYIAWDSLAEDLIVIPYIYGAAAPENDPTARAAILGLGPHHTPRNVMLGWMEGISFETLRNLRFFAELGTAPARMKMIGGAGKSSVWPQMIADICAIPIDVLEVSDAATLGAACLAGRGIGLWNALPHYPIARTCQPDPERRERFAKKFEIYMKAVELERERRRWLMNAGRPGL